MFFACGMCAATFVVFSIPHDLFYIGSGLDIRKVTVLTVLQPIHPPFLPRLFFFFVKRLNELLFVVNTYILSCQVVLLLQITMKKNCKTLMSGLVH